MSGDTTPRRDARTRERNVFWGAQYHSRLAAGASKEQARRYACDRTVAEYGSSPFMEGPR